VRHLNESDQGTEDAVFASGQKTESRNARVFCTCQSTDIARGASLMLTYASRPTAVSDASCPITTVAPSGHELEMDDELVLLNSRRTIVQYAKGTDGTTELRLYYGDKEISFDEPNLFSFGETIARQERFTARAATEWGNDLEWTQVRPLLEQLLDAGILVRATDATSGTIIRPDSIQTSPLPPSVCPLARSWSDCASITRELTGRAVDPAHLELVIPIFRVAHIMVDTDHRQVGEANVFPRALRLDVPTEWWTSNLPGSRYLSEKPMNVTAMKVMRAHWPQMMAGLLRVREAFLRRFPKVEGAWTVGDLERLSTAVLAVPTYQAMRRGGVANGQLHATLSSMFRVTDGLRMVMHQMLFIPVGEPVIPPT